jgi:hypothetical protein
MKSDHELEVDIEKTMLAHRGVFDQDVWTWTVTLNGLKISSIFKPGGGCYTTPRGAKEAFKRWLKGTGKILYFICPIGHLALKPKVNIRSISNSRSRGNEKRRRGWKIITKVKGLLLSKD